MPPKWWPTKQGFNFNVNFIKKKKFSETFVDIDLTSNCSLSTFCILCSVFTAVRMKIYSFFQIKETKINNIIIVE